MYARPPPRQGPRTSDLAVWPAPTGGLVANRNLATPAGTPAATRLENFFPTATGAVIRRGSNLYATVGGGAANVEEMWTYVSGSQEEFFAATATTIYDISTPSAPATVFSGFTSGDWVVTQFATTGGTFLVAVNGSDQMMIYDGSFWFPVHASNYYTLGYYEGTGEFTLGQTITGTDSGATGTIIAGIIGGEIENTIEKGTLLLSNVTGIFIAEEELTDPTGGLAFATGTQKLISDLYVLPYDTGTGPFTVGQTVYSLATGAAARILSIEGTTAVGTLIADQLRGVFENDAVLEDDLGGSALVNGTATLRFSGITGLPDGVDTRIWSYVWIYQNRLFFVEKDTLNGWYLAVDSIGGEATVFPLGGVYALGGSLLFGSSWNIESSDGLSSRCIFVTGNESNAIGNEGEIAIYAGLDPSDPNQWGLIGVYRSGMPMGKKAHVRAGGELIIATDLGLIPLSVALQRDVAALAPSSLSFSIEDEWAVNVERRSAVEWKCKTWPTGRMMVVMLPTVAGTTPKWLVGNVRTGAWTVFTGLDAKCLAVYQDRLFFGSTAGKVVEAMVTGLDQGLPYTATFVPLFEDLGSPASLKIPTLARAIIRSPVTAINPTLKMLSDFEIELQAAPAAIPVPANSIWGVGVWGDPLVGGNMIWGGATVSLHTVQRWVSVSGLGYTLSPALRLTSGSVQPLDAELVRMEGMHTVAEVVS